MEFCNIVGIYKGKGEKIDLENERGIFIVNIFRSLVMKLIYEDKYGTVDAICQTLMLAPEKRKVSGIIFL